MSYSMYLCLTLATSGLPSHEDAEPNCDLNDATGPGMDRIRTLVEKLRNGVLSPLVVAQFEKELKQELGELGRAVSAWTYNHLEGGAARSLPDRVHFEGSPYRRLSKKTRQEVSTLFGKVQWYRQGYRAAASVGDRVLFPLCRELGLVQGATPALVECVARYQAESGATQKQTLARLRREHGISWGVKKLRQVTEFVAAAMDGHRQAAQVDRVLEWLRQAEASRGQHRPVLGVGRDGITLGLQIKGYNIYEVASAGTLTVYDRRGRRLGTVYLAYTPEPGQATMSLHLTGLLTEVLRRWSGRLPRLAYVTDAGDNETSYYRKELRRLRHPRTGERWFWVVDYYHASERLWTMADALFGAGPKARSWARKMQRLLLKPAGVSRVLHSAGALRSRGKLTATRLAQFRRAYNYLHSRRRHLRYDEYRRLGLPIGSGVTEAACKTVYTQRLKLSGMRWKQAGAQTILTLRVILLSGVWDTVYAQTLATSSEVEVRTSSLSKGSAPVSAA